MLYPTKRPANPVEGQLVYDPDVSKFNVFAGAKIGWVYFDESGNYYDCVVCKKGLYQHAADHPFCKNNLEYLEWKAQ